MIPDNQSFLFTLANPFGSEPIKLNPKLSLAAIRCRSDVGPTFGESSSSAYDLTVWDPEYGSSIHLGFGHICPKTINVFQRKTYFAGVSPFQVSELEVFKVNL